MDCPGLFLVAYPGTGESTEKSEEPLIPTGVFTRLDSEICLLVDDPLWAGELELVASGLGVGPLLVGL